MVNSYLLLSALIFSFLFSFWRSDDATNKLVKFTLLMLAIFGALCWFYSNGYIVKVS